jgi:hypothetical protein
MSATTRRYPIELSEVDWEQSDRALSHTNVISHLGTRTREVAATAPDAENDPWKGGTLQTLRSHTFVVHDCCTLNTKGVSFISLPLHSMRRGL